VSLLTDTEPIGMNMELPLLPLEPLGRLSRLWSLLQGLRDSLRGRLQIIAKVLASAVVLVLLFELLSFGGLFGPRSLVAALACRGLGRAARAFIDGFQREYEYWDEEAIIARRETDAWTKLF
jgi:hypothetical protein